MKITKKRSTNKCINNQYSMYKFQSGLFPLHLAIMENDPMIRETYVRRLISLGANVNAKALPVRES